MDFKNAFIDDLLYSMNEYLPKLKTIAWYPEPFTIILILGENVYDFDYENKMKLYEITEELCDEYEYNFEKIKEKLNVIESIISEGKHTLNYNHIDENE